MQLRILKGYHAGNQLELTKKDFSVGREPDNDFVVPDPEISRHHCLILNLNQTWTVKDLQSRNGVAVNGKKIDGTQTLRDGDEITLYQLVMKFEDETKTHIQTPPAISHDQPKKDGMDSPHQTFITTDPVKKDQEDNQDDARMPDPWELIVPLAKAAILVVIIAAIAVLAYLLMAGNGEDTRNETEQTTAEQEPEKNKIESLPQVQTETIPTRHARGEQLLEDRDKTIQTNNPNPVTPPPPKPRRNDLLRSMNQPLTPKTSQDRKEQSPTPRPKNRTVFVKSIPSGAQVTINGQVQQPTPTVLTNLKEDNVAIQLELPGYERKTILVKVADGLNLPTVRLVQKVGTLRVQSNPPGALVTEGRIVYGATPLLIQDLRPGTHKLILERRDCNKQEVTVTMTEAKGEQLNVNLKQQLGNLEITSIPPQCKVFLDGLEIGTTEPDGQRILSRPLRAEKIVPGTCAIKVLHPATGAFDTTTKNVPQNGTATYRAFIWIPTHKLVLANNTTTIGMLMQKNQDAVTIMTVDNKKRNILTKDYTKLLELPLEEQVHILKMRASKDPSGQFSTKSKLSILAEDFLKQANFPAFKGYVKSKLCITGQVTMRMKTPKGTVVHFGKQIRCILAPTASRDDYKKIGQLEDAGKAVSLRGIYEGELNNVFVFTNCVLLPYPD